jgi:hypothetical protein
MNRLKIKLIFGPIIKANQNTDNQHIINKREIYKSVI